ncbi:hypothetical protein AK812_SmicGene39270 [Symbiodinium microadriaticum]|uniref:Magnesium transporter MgtE intracellular domain-containing protein n=1 Tax=Symbiodinium microadriaticum TaxID=2951 RepID=A0A1Q9CBP3_SYMMI|nr:hypothetical protein AK812_SmicGene39270 [Symbiodinium microadriaticum]CAE7022454.1 unnamed protein product [Symbiodinium sp. KB8]CAE7218843.1 unnamed protein product [Symbiodinium microadriaticum]
MASADESEDDEEVADALEARLSTLQHLSPEEAATMLGRMPPRQAGQLVLLMGSENRAAILAAMPDAAKEAVAGTLPTDTADALGLVVASTSTETDATDSVAEVRQGLEAPALPAEERDPGTQQFQETHESKEQQDLPREDKHGTKDAPHMNKEQGADAEAEVLEGAQQCAGELREEQVQRTEPEATEQEEIVTEAVDGMDRDERLASDEAVAAQAHAGCSAGMSNSAAAGELAASCLTGDSDPIPANFAPSNQQPAVESGYPSNSSPSKAEQKLEVSSACAALEDEPEIIDTWLLNNKPAVREHPCRSILVMEPSSRAAEGASSEAAQVALHLSPLCNATIARYFQETPVEEWEAILAHFPPERRKDIMDILWEDTSSFSSESSSKAIPARMSRAMGMAGTFAARARQGISEMAPEASHKAAYASTEMKRAAAAASHAAVWARQSVTHAADKAVTTKSVERAKTAANSAMSAARVGVSTAAHKAETAKSLVSEAAGAAKHSVSHLVSTSSASDAVENSGRLARQMTNEAKQKVSGATEVAKAQFASMSKGMAGFFKK